jgi:nicotinate phosphoribosyltransferase
MPPTVTDPGLLTDLYQLGMMQAYLENDMTDEAVFEFFVRKLPLRRSFLMAAGLEQVLDHLETLRFTGQELEWLASTGQFGKSFIDHLAGFRFTGGIHAMPEGTVFFPDEPILRVTAPLPEAQLVESRLINLLHFQTVIASKAARIVLVAGGRTLVDFGFRRAHGAEAGLFAARAAWLAGFDGTATVEAGRQFGIPVHGTMAHSFIQAHDDEAVAFEHFARARPERPVLLIDTYDTETGAHRVAALAPKLAASGVHIAGVRLDSGDLEALSKRVRAILDGAGLSAVAVLASGGIDEQTIERLLAAGSPIDGFGVGTSLTTASDAPALDCAYKLQEYAGRPRRKRSAGKATWPGRKQVYRQTGSDAHIIADSLSLEDDPQDGVPLIAAVMRDGRRLEPSPTLEQARRYAADQLAALPDALRDISQVSTYPVTISAVLRAMTETVDRRAT